MAQPLRSDDPKPQSMQFAHFGVLNDGNQSKGSLFTSVALNILLAICAIIIGAAAKKTMDNHIKLTHLDEPIPRLLVRHEVKMRELADRVPQQLVHGATHVAGGLIKGNRHVEVAKDTPMTNMMLSLMDTLGVHADSLGDSTGRLAEFAA